MPWTPESYGGYPMSPFSPEEQDANLAAAQGYLGARVPPQDEQDLLAASQGMIQQTPVAMPNDMQVQSIVPSEPQAQPEQMTAPKKVDRRQNAMDLAATLVKERAAKAEADNAMAERETADAKQMESDAVAVGQQHARDSQALNDEWDRIGTVDPKRLFKNQSTLANAGTLFAAFIGGVSQVANKQGNNQVLDAINASINRDIAAQEKEIGDKKDKLNFKGNQLAQNYAILKDMNQAKIVTAGMQRNAMARQAEARFAGIDNEKIRNNALENVAKLDEQTAKEQEAIKQQRFQNAMEERRVRVSEDGLQLQRDQLKADKEMAAAKAAAVKGIDPEKAVYDQNGNPIGQARGSTEAKELSNKISGFNELNQQLSELDAMVEGGASTNIDWPIVGKVREDKESALLDSTYNKMLSAYGKAVSGGQVATSELDRFKLTFPEPGNWMTSAKTREAKRAVWKNEIAAARDKIATELKTAGIDPSAVLQGAGAKSSAIKKDGQISSMINPAGEATQGGTPTGQEKLKKDLEAKGIHPSASGYMGGGF